MTTKPPFADYESIAAIFRIANGDHNPRAAYDLPEGCSKEASSFLDACFTRDPARRPNALQLLQHDFVVGEV